MIAKFRPALALFILIFSMYVSAEVGPVLPGQALWCVTQRIGSNLDIIESKLCEIDFSALDTNVSLFQEIMCSKIEVITDNTVDAQPKVDNASSIVDIFTLCMPMAISATTTIDASGIYCVTSNFSGTITISADDVQLNINNHVVIGGVEVTGGQSNIKIYGGTIEGTGSADAILVNSGVSNVAVENVVVKNATGASNAGINFDGVAGGSIINATAVDNTTGVLITDSSKIIIDQSTANCNTDAGFSLVSSSTCCVTNCKALSTGQGNETTGAVDIFGFVSAGGYGNVFENCIANGTQSLATIDFDSNIAGIALRFDSSNVPERCSKIISCESANAQTDDTSQARPIGIWLEQVLLDSSLTVTFISETNSSRSRTVRFSPDTQFLVDGGEGDTIRIHKLNRSPFNVELVQTLAPGFGDIFACNWSPDGQFVAVGFRATNGVHIYKFDHITYELTQVAFSTLLPSVYGLDWSPDGRYLAVLEGVSPFRLAIFHFNRINYEFTFVDSLDAIGGSNANLQANVSWNPDGKFIAAANAGQSGTVVSLCTFVNETLLQVHTTTFGGGGFPNDLDWSFDGSLLFVSSFQPRVGRLNRATQQLEDFSTTVAITSIGCNWAPDGSYIAVGRFQDPSTNPNVEAVRYDRDANTLSIAASSDALGISRAARNSWSKDGRYIAQVVGNVGEFYLLEALHSVEKCVVKDNVVYCNSGGSDPTGIGISANSVSNLVIGNTSYANPINPPGGVETNYAFVTNVFNPLFNNEPTLLQNISIGGCEAIPMQEDLGLLAQQEKAGIQNLSSIISVIESKIDGFTMANMPPCAATPIVQADMPTVLTTAGIYCVGEPLTGALTVDGADIELDLNQYRVTGSITVNADRTNVRIHDGVVDADGGDEAIAVNSGVHGITIDNVAAKNAIIGMSLAGVSDGVIKNCSMTSNVTGVELNQSHKIMFESCTAACNTNAGFCLLSSTTNCFTDCKALSTGEGNSNVLNQTICGFVSANGNGNIFERCIANATQGLQVTDSDSLVAGFALRGSEQCTKVIECESGNTQTDPAGATVPYGILLENNENLKKNVVMRNIVYCNKSGTNGTGISGSNLNNLIIQNTLYNNPINLLTGSLVDEIASALDSPTLLQNIIVEGCEPICMPADLGLLSKQIAYQIDLDQSIVDIADSKIDVINATIIGKKACMPMVVSSAPTTLATSGIYCLSNNVLGDITITADDVQFDLNNYKVTGEISINNGVSNTLIKGGVVDNNDANGNGIVATNASNITVHHVTVKNALIGINLQEVTGGLIEHCTMTQNTTGLELDQSHKIVINSCVAECNTNAGFCLLSSTTNCLSDCKALSTGEGNTNVLNQTVIGFVSADGYGNIFERCIANATQALSTTDYNSVVAGFALRGAEGCTKIIECESANATTSPEGVTVPYGILLAGELDTDLTVTAIPTIPDTSTQRIRGVSWRSDGKYLAVAADITDDEVKVFKFDYTRFILTQVDLFSSLANDVNWSPSGSLLGVVDDDGTIEIYTFDSSTQTLTLLSSLATNLTGGTNAPIWTPDEKYIAVPRAAGSGSGFTMFSFDRITGAMSFVAETTNVPFSSNIDVSPDGRFIAVAPAFSGSDFSFRVFLFENDTLTQVASAGPTVGQKSTVAWSPNGVYLATSDAANSLIRIYSFNPNTFALIEQVSVSSVGAELSWSPDGKYLSVGISGNIIVYEFDPGAKSLVQVASRALSGTWRVRWSPDGSFIAIIDRSTTAGLQLLQAVSFPSKNVIKDNVVYCNSGGAIPSGVGISGSSIANMIIGNAAYSNPLSPPVVGTNYQFVTNVFNQNFGNGPSLLQNISLDCDEPICMPTDIGLLLKQSKQKLCDASTNLITVESLLDNIGNAIAMGPCDATPITSSPTTLSGSTHYCIANSGITGLITIDGSDVQLDLNNYTITGGIEITSGQDNITISNGTVSNSGSDAIKVNSGCSDITIQDVHAKDSLIGINCDTVVGGLIQNCSMTSNTTGLQLCSAYKITVDSCTASCNTNAGFDLKQTSSFNCLIDCKALSTGEGNTQITDQTIFGFISTDGIGNIFERCIANGTQGLQVTDSDSLIAGFALRGSEQCTKIIECEAACAVTSFAGNAIAYGIYLENNTQLTKNVIVQNIVYGNSGGGGAVGVTGSDLYNFIVQNVAYNNTVNYQVGSLADQDISQLDNPSALQNIALGGCEQVGMPEDLGLLLKQIDNKIPDLGCSQIEITSADISGGTISITTGGSYCMATDLTADMLISATCASIDMNNRILTGEIIIQDSKDVSVFDGRVQPSAPTSNGQTAVTIAADALRTQLLRLNIVCADTSADSIDGRSGIDLFGDDALIEDCTIKSGAGAANTSGTGGAGGTGIILNNGTQGALIKQCVIRTGAGGDGTTQGGNGGDGIVVNDTVVGTKIIGCTILQVGGPGSPLGASSPQGGDGIVINSGSSKTMVTQCIVRNTSAGVGTTSAGGLAVDNRSVADARSVIYQNVVYNIGNSVKYSNFGSGMLNEFGVQMDAPPSNDPLNTVANVFFDPLATP